MIKIGDKFGRLVIIGIGKVIEYRYPEKTIRIKCYFVECICGTKKEVRGVCLTRGTTTSCGCYNREVLQEGTYIKHGHSSGGRMSPTYESWHAMKGRCLNPNNDHYKEYGGRGIKVCDSWLNSFENFLADMKERPEGKTLNRLNNDGDYCKENCEWATAKEQANNRRYPIRNRWWSLSEITKKRL